MYVWGDVELTVRVDLPDKPEETRTLVWLKLATKPEGDTVLETLTLPEKPSTLPSVMSVETGLEPCRTVNVDPDEILKSTTLTETWTERDMVPVVAVIVTVNDAGTVEMTVNREPPDIPWERVTLAGLREAVKPCDETVAVRVRVPEKPLTAPMLIVSLVGTPLSAIIDSWPAETVKSVTLRDTLIE